jgi:hypothetical protein
VNSTRIERVCLQIEVAKLVRAAGQVGLRVEDLIDLLTGGLTALQIATYLETQASAHAVN